MYRNQETAASKPLPGAVPAAGAHHDLVIVGSGPAGLSAAARAQALGLRYVLLEAQPHVSHTIHQFSKGKHVMAEPSALPLRSDLPFGPSSREAVLDAWRDALQAQGLAIRYGRRVVAIRREAEGGVFTLECDDRSSLVARQVVLAIGLQGNIRKLGVPGQDLPRVHYTLADPDEFADETIVVVGAGDAGIENALSLSRQNRVHLFNRHDEFTVCTDRNRENVLEATRSGRLAIHYGTAVARIETADDGVSLRVVSQGKDGETVIACDRVIGRLGATAPRKLLESFGILFPNADPAAVPALSEAYESNVPGLFVVGALAGYPLIKQAMNQGYEVVQALVGQPVEPVSDAPLREKFAAWRPGVPVKEVIDGIAAAVPLFRAMTRLQLREFLLDAQVHRPRAGSVIFRKFDYTDTFFAILEGHVACEVDAKDGGSARIRLGAGAYFGELALMSGRRRTATVNAEAGCVLLEIPRRSMLKAMASVADLQKQIDDVFIRNALASYLGPTIGSDAIDELVRSGIETRTYRAQEVLFRRGDRADGLYLIRRGSVMVSSVVGGQEQVLSYVAAGHYVGEIALIDDRPRSATVTAAVLTEVLVLKADGVREQLARHPQWQRELRSKVLQRTRTNVLLEDQAGPQSGVVRFLVGQGVGEASDVLLIDESLCIHCDNCETACAATHGGTSRLRRERGPTFANIHLPSACRHCEHPHCMKDCPPDAISRSASGEVFISDACIGCGQCERNCPYEVIQMVATEPPRPGVWAWLTSLATRRAGPAADGDAPKKAVKCDLCRDQKGGAACVRACPTGAAVRTSPEAFFRQIAGRAVE